MPRKKSGSRYDLHFGAAPPMRRMDVRCVVAMLMLRASPTSALRLPRANLIRARHDAIVVAASVIVLASPPALAWDLPTATLVSVVCDDRGRCTKPQAVGAATQKQPSTDLQRAAKSAQGAANKILADADNGARVSQAKAAKMQADAAKEAKKVIPKDVQKAAAKASRDVEKGVTKVQKDVTKEAKKVIPKDVQRAAAKAQKDATKEVKKAEKEVNKAKREVEQAATKLQRDFGL